MKLVFHCFQLIFTIFWTFFHWPVTIESRGTPINLYEQPGNLHRGPGDIANLWVGFTGDGSFRGQPVPRNAIKPQSQNRWTRYQNDRGQYIIPYIVSGKFGVDDSQEHAIIARAMMAIAENTCIKFEKRGGEADYVDLKNERGEGCYTVVGRSAGKNTVMLETNEIATCLEFDIVIHELMHTIGLWHEQMRYDRDEFIKIHWENIGPAYVTQFEKIPDTDSTTYGVKYDYQSVMHYAKDAFASAPGKITMETLDKQFQDVIGKVKDASPSDYLKICNIYACHTCMGHPFTPGQSRPGDGQRVITLGPGVVTLPTASPSPATLPLKSTTPSVPLAPTVPPVTVPSPPKNEGTHDNISKEREDGRIRPTPVLPIILPLINNNWWWKNTPAPPLRDPHGRLLLWDDAEKQQETIDGNGSENGEKLGDKLKKMAKIEEEVRLKEKTELEKEEESVEEEKHGKKKLKGKKEKPSSSSSSSSQEEEHVEWREIQAKSNSAEEENSESKENFAIKKETEENPKTKPTNETECPVKTNCQDSAFCHRLFPTVDTKPSQQHHHQQALKTCVLGVIKRHCCASCKGRGYKKETVETEEDGEKKLKVKGKKLKKSSRKGRKRLQQNSEEND